MDCILNRKNEPLFSVFELFWIVFGLTTAACHQCVQFEFASKGERESELRRRVTLHITARGTGSVSSPSVVSFCFFIKMRKRGGGASNPKKMQQWIECVSDSESWTCCKIPSGAAIIESHFLSKWVRLRHWPVSLAYIWAAFVSSWSGAAAGRRGEREGERMHGRALRVFG